MATARSVISTDAARVLVDPAYDLVLVFMTSIWQHSVTGNEAIQVTQLMITFGKIQQV